MTPTIEQIIEAQKILDAQKVPTEGRILRYVGEDGQVYEISDGSKNKAATRSRSGQRF